MQLNNGTVIPDLGLGTYKMTSLQAEKAVITAVKLGYRHIDTASYYDNENGVGRGIKNCQIPREELFITTKLWPDDYKYAKKAFEKSLRLLDLDYVDLYLIHWPMAGWQHAWEQLEQIFDSGKAKAIGISNFTVKHMHEMLEIMRVAPAVNQFELHPYMFQEDMINFSKQNNFQVTAYAPLGRCRHFDDPRVQAIAQEHNKTPAQIFLRWAFQHGAAVIPKSTHEARIKENMDFFDFKLKKEEMDSLNTIGEEDRVAPSPHDME